MHREKLDLVLQGADEVREKVQIACLLPLQAEAFEVALGWAFWRVHLEGYEEGRRYESGHMVTRLLIEEGHVESVSTQFQIHFALLDKVCDNFRLFGILLQLFETNYLSFGRSAPRNAGEGLLRDH